MMKKNINKFKIISYSLLAIATIAFSITSFSIAAFLDQEEQKQNITVNLDYSIYFNGGNGTKDSPYQINSQEQLSNLSKLTAFGCFNQNHYFILTSDITWNNTLVGYETLLPIGNDDTPFYSSFDGQGHKITDLKVLGCDLATVGMFGFVANGASVSNFILINPYVTSTSRNTQFEYSYATLSSNPYRKSITEDVASSISLVEGTKVTQGSGGNAVEIGITSFSLNLGSVISTAFPKVKFLVSNPSYFTSYPKDTTVAASTDFTLDTTNTASAYLTVEIYVEGLSPIILDDNSTEYRYIRYTIERYKFYYDAETKCISKSSTTGKHYLKMMHEPVSSVTSGTVTTKYYNKKVIYSGVVIGELNGTAANIGVVNPTLTGEYRPFRSNSILIGHKIDDDERGLLSKEDIDFTDTFSNPNNLTPVYTQEDGGLLNPSNDKNTRTSNYYINNVYGINGSLTNNAQKTIRFYGDGNDGVSLKTRNYIKRNEATGQTLNTSGKFLSYSKDLKGYLSEKNTPAWFINDGNKSLSLKNAIYFWATKDYGNSGNIIGDLLTAKGDFNLSFTFDYLFFDSNIKEDLTGNSNIKLAGYGCSYMENPKDNGILSYYNKYGQGYGSQGSSANYLSNLYNVNTGVVGTLDSDYKGGYIENNDDGTAPTTFYANDINDPTYDANKYYELKQKTIKFRTNSSTFNFDLSSGRSPLIMMGMNSSALTTPTNYEFDILNLSIVISDVNGNVSSDPITVDFFPSDYSTTYTDTNPLIYGDGTWNNWTSDSVRKVTATCFSESPISDTNYNPTIYSDKGYNFYKINVGRTDTAGGWFQNSSSTITVTYKYSGVINNNLIPFNNLGYKEANIASGEVA